MLRVTTLRRFFAALVLVLPLAAVSLPALALEAEEFAETRDAWSANRAELAETTTGLEAIDAAAAAATAGYEAVQQRLNTAQERLAQLRQRVAAAAARQRAADKANDVAIRRLGQATMVLVTVEEALADHVADLDVELVAAYKYAGASAQFRGVMDALQDSGSITEFTDTYEMLRTTTVGQSRLVDSVTALAQRVTEQRVIVRTLQRQTDRVELTATERRRQVAALTNQQSETVEQIRSAKRERARLLRQLRTQQQAYTGRVEALQAQSDALLEELRQYRYVGGAPGSKDLLWPTDGMVTSGYGYRHHPIFKSRRLHAGMDIPAPTGQPIYAAADGTVVKAGAYGGYGIAVVIDHGEGMSTVYAHQSQMAVRAGQTVLAGDTVGYVGSTGFSTGPHLHFEIRLGGRPTNPLDWY